MERRLWLGAAAKAAVEQLLEALGIGVRCVAVLAKLAEALAALVRAEVLVECRAVADFPGLGNPDTLEKALVDLVLRHLAHLNDSVGGYVPPVCLSAGGSVGRQLCPDNALGPDECVNCRSGTLFALKRDHARSLDIRVNQPLHEIREEDMVASVQPRGCEPFD